MVAILFATWGVVFLDRGALLYLAPYIVPDLGLNESQVGMLAGAVTIILGRLGTRVRRRVRPRRAQGRARADDPLVLRVVGGIRLRAGFALAFADPRIARGD